MKRIKLWQKIFALLLAISLPCIFGAVLFAGNAEAEGDSTIVNPASESDDNVTISKQALSRDNQVGVWNMEMTATATTTVEPQQLQVVFVMDVSSSMDRRDLGSDDSRYDAAQTAANGLLETLQGNENIKVQNLVSFNQNAEIIDDDYYPTDRPDGSGTNLIGGFRVGEEQFDGDAQQIMIILCDGEPNCYPNGQGGETFKPGDDGRKEAFPTEAANAFKQKGGEIYVIALKTEAMPLLKDLASGNDYYYTANDAQELTIAFDTIETKINAMIVDNLGADVQIDGDVTISGAATAIVTPTHADSFKWDGATLSDGDTVAATYNVKLNAVPEKVGPNKIMLNGEATLNYSLDGEPQTALNFGIPYDAIQVGSIQTAYVDEKGEDISRYLTNDQPEYNGGDAKYLITDWTPLSFADEFTVSTYQHSLIINNTDYYSFKEAVITKDGVSVTSLDETIEPNAYLITYVYTYSDEALYQVSYRYTGEYSGENLPAGASALPENASYKSGASVTVAAAATAANFDFSGWSVAEGGAEINDGAFSMPAKAVILEGSFTPQEPTYYQVRYEYVGDVPSVDNVAIVPDQDEKNYGYTPELEEATVAADPTFDGYSFSGWYLTYSDNTLSDKAGTTVASEDGEDVTLYGAWTKDVVVANYQVLYEYVGTVPSGAPEAPVDETSYGFSPIQESATVLGARALDGYTFHGWYLDNACSNSAGATVSSADGSDVTLYGYWTANTVPVYEYSIQYYLQDDYDSDSYTLDPNRTVSGLYAAVNTEVTASGYVADIPDYTYDGDNANQVWSGIVTDSNNVTLRLYYNLPAPGTFDYEIIARYYTIYNFDEDDYYLLSLDEVEDDPDTVYDGRDTLEEGNLLIGQSLVFPDDFSGDMDDYQTDRYEGERYRLLSEDEDALDGAEIDEDNNTITLHYVRNIIEDDPPYEPPYTPPYNPPYEPPYTPPTITIVDDDVPLSSAPQTQISQPAQPTETIDIFDDAVPLDATPRTGDSTPLTLALALALVSLIGLIVTITIECRQTAR